MMAYGNTEFREGCTIQPQAFVAASLYLHIGSEDGEEIKTLEQLRLLVCLENTEKRPHGGLQPLMRGAEGQHWSLLWSDSNRAERMAWGCVRGGSDWEFLKGSSSGGGGHGTSCPGQQSKP